MKKILLTILTLLNLIKSATLQAGIDPIFDDAMIEFRSSYFYPSSSSFRKIFDHAKVNYELTSTIPLYVESCAWTQQMNLWIALDYFSCKGDSTALHDKTHIRIIPITLGLKYFYPLPCQQMPLNFYLAGGMKYYFVHTHNHSDQVKKTMDRKGLGGVLEVGFLTTIKNHLVLDLFVSYSFKSFGAPSHSTPAVKMTGMNISGVNIGGGIGYQF